MKKLSENICSFFDALCSTWNIPEGKWKIEIFILIFIVSIVFPISNYVKEWRISNNENVKVDLSNNIAYQEHNPKLDQYFKNIEDAYPSYPFYPIAVDMKNVHTVGEWTYFIHDVSDTFSNEELKYPALFKFKNDEAAIRVSPRACYNYQIINESVFYLDVTTSIPDHGELYVSRPDGKNERLLDEELYKFQIVENKYIYFVYRHDTIGVGLDGHALYRMNLDGSNRIIVAYEVSGLEFGSSHFDFEVKGDWVYYGNSFRMKLGEPANGLETVELLSPINRYEDDYIYYVTNRLIKAKKDGSDIIELDGKDTYHYEINKMDAECIYYTKGNDNYKIKKDGTDKERI